MELLKNPLVTSLLGAVLGFFAKTLIDYLKQVRLSQEAARLTFLKEQLSEFIGLSTLDYSAMVLSGD